VEGVAELLQQSVGARVVQYGGLGAFSTLSLRGASPGQVSVFLDGMPLTSAAHGVVSLGDLPVSALDRLEVYRGLAPLGFGAATPGGAVNLVTVDAPRARDLHVAAGSFGTGEARGTFGGSRGALALLANAGWEGARGDYAFLDDNGTPFTTADDEVVRRLNNRFDAAHALARLAWTPRPLARATLRVEGFRKAQGVPGLSQVQAPNPRLALERGLVALEAARAPARALPGLLLRAHAQRERSHFRDPEGELHLGRQDGTTRLADQEASLAAASPAGWSALTAESGVAARGETADPAPASLGFNAPPESRRDTRSAWVTLQLHAPGDALVLHAARRWDRQRDRVRALPTVGAPYAADATRTLDAPQLGARARLVRGFEARANWTKAARAPELGELFGDQAVVGANPKLVPERGENWDATLAWSGAGAGWAAGGEWTRFASHERDLIAYVPSVARTFRAVNFSRAEIRGEEFTAHAVWRAATLSGSTGWTSALQTGSDNLYRGRRLPLRPARQAAARADVRIRAWRVAADVVYLGDDYRDAINFQRLPSRTFLGASLARTWGRLTWTAEGRNLGDRRVSDVAGYPLPGRSAFVSCDMRFGPTR
jgi:iron complex outermembrane receptor protein